MSDDDRPDAITVTRAWEKGDPENCLHCRIRGWLAAGIVREMGGTIEIDEFVGALIACAGEMISHAPTPRLRKEFLRRAQILLNKESRPGRPEQEHEH